MGFAEELEEVNERASSENKAAIADVLRKRPISRKGWQNLLRNGNAGLAKRLTPTPWPLLWPHRYLLRPGLREPFPEHLRLHLGIHGFQVREGLLQGEARGQAFCGTHAHFFAFRVDRRGRRDGDPPLLSRSFGAATGSATATTSPTRTSRRSPAPSSRTRRASDSGRSCTSTTIPAASSPCLRWATRAKR